MSGKHFVNIISPRAVESLLSQVLLAPRPGGYIRTIQEPTWFHSLGKRSDFIKVFSPLFCFPHPNDSLYFHINSWIPSVFYPNISLIFNKKNSIYSSNPKQE